MISNTITTRLEHEASTCQQKVNMCEVELDNGKKCVELLLSEISQMETHLAQMSQHSTGTTRDQTGVNESRYSFCSPGEPFRH